MIELLLSKGAEIDSRSKGRTALQISSASGHTDALELLLSNGADIHSRSEGLTTLDMAFANGQREVIELLLFKGAVLEAVSCHISEEETMRR